MEPVNLYTNIGFKWNQAHTQLHHKWADNTLVSTLANSTLIKLFSEMLNFFWKYFFQIK